MGRRRPHKCGGVHAETYTGSARRARILNANSHFPSQMSIRRLMDLISHQRPIHQKDRFLAGPLLPNRRSGQESLGRTPRNFAGPPARALQRPQPQTARFHATGASPRQTARAYSDRAPVAAPSAAAAARRNILATERSAPLGGAPAAQPADRRARTPARRARLSAGPERGSRRDPPACAARVPSGRGAAAAAVCVRRAGGVQGLFGAPLAAPTR